MNRRSFFKSFFSTVAAVAVAQRLVVDLALATRSSVIPIYLMTWTSEVRRISPLEIYSKLFGNVKWEPNMGSVLRPIGDASNLR